MLTYIKSSRISACVRHEKSAPAGRPSHRAWQMGYIHGA
jgi:hypothetical protein